MGALLLSIIAVCYSHLAKLTTRNGGVYVYAGLAYGSKRAYAMGWINWVGMSVGTGVMAATVGKGIQNGTDGKLIAIALLCILAFINFRGIRYGGRMLIFFAILKLAPLCAIGILSVLCRQTQGIENLAPNLSLQEISLAVVMTLFSLQGFESVPVVAGETASPRRQIPLALLTSLWTAVALYTLIQFAVVFNNIQGSEQPLAELGAHVLGPVGGTIFQWLSLVSILGLVAARALVVPRILAPICEDRFLPESLALQHIRYHTPSYAILVTLAISIGAVFLMGVENFVEVSALTIAAQYFVSCLSLYSLTPRKRQMGKRFLAPSGALLSLIFIGQPSLKAWVTLGGIVTLGYALSWISIYANANPPKPSQRKLPADI